MNVSDAEPARPAPGRSGKDLLLRAASALVLAPLAVGIAYLGGWIFAIFWGVVAIIVMCEWTMLVSGADRDRAAWLAAGVPYAGAMALAPIVLRSDPEFGFVAMIFLFAVVWATDIAAYFVGRAAGGPKLAPRLSPNKTWSGAIGGLAGAVLAALLVVHFSGAGGVLAAAVVAIALSATAQVGDLAESAMKRRFGVKDASSLIPGHGGLMDRLDGFVTAAVLACLIGLAHGGINAPARGLLIW
jgi:phosphatidate cytidylyltransferase